MRGTGNVAAREFHRAFAAAVAAHRLGDLETAIAAYEQLRSKHPGDARVLSNLASALRRTGRRDEALSCFHEATASGTATAETWFNFGNLLAEFEQLAEAESAYRRALDLDSGLYHAATNLANLLARNGRAEEAVELHRHAITAASDNVPSRRALARLLYERHDLAEAERLYREVLGLAPVDAEALNALGVVLKDLGRSDEAVECWQKALNFAPNYAAARNNLGVMYRLMHQPGNAVQQLREAARLDPGDAMTAANLAHALIDLGQIAEAEEIARAITVRDPNNAEGHLMAGFALAYRGRIEEAIDAFLEAHLHAPQSPMPISNALFASLYSERRTAADILALHRRLSASIVPAVPPLIHSRPSASARRRLRIGYLSPDFRAHPVAAFFEPILANHDVQQFEIFCYSTTSALDAVTDRLRAHASAWRDCQGWDDARLVAQIEGDGIDILVDLAGHTAQNRVAVLRSKPAPVQVLYIGYPGTSGLPELDYLIADARVCPSELEHLYTERIARVESSFWCFQPPMAAPEAGPLAAKRNGHITFGSFNALQKISDGTVALWARILHLIPDSRLFLKSLSFADADVRRSMRERFAAAGIARDRIDAQPPSDRNVLLSEYRRVDIALDPFPYNGGTTTCEALWMGVPVVTLQGERFCGRMGTSLLHGAGLPDLVAQTVDDYVGIAARLASDLPGLEALRRALRTRMAASPVCDAVRGTRELERAYREMWRNWCGNS